MTKVYHCTPDLSIVIVSFKTRDYLRRCLDSVEVYSEPLRVETIVVDNASGDGTVDMLASQFPDTDLIANDENRGFASACNQGIRVASGRHILLLNPDTEIRPNTLPTMVKFLDEHPRVGALGCLVLDEHREPSSTGHVIPGLGTAFVHAFRLKPILKAFIPRGRLAPKWLRDIVGRYAGEFRSRRDVPYPVDYLSGCCLLFRRNVVETVGYLDENFFLDWEDVDFCHRMKTEGWQLYYHPGVSIIHQWEAARKANVRRSLIARYRSMLYFYCKTYGPFAFAVVKAILVTAFTGRWILGRVRSCLYASHDGSRSPAVTAYRDVVRLSLAAANIKAKALKARGSRGRDR